MIVRPADLADIPHIRAIAHATWPATYGNILSAEQLVYMLELMYSEEALLQQINDKGHRFLIASEAGSACGFAAFETHYKGSLSTRLHKLYVLPGTQGKGIGHSLLVAVERSAADSGDERIELNVNRYNDTVRWYVRQGFSILVDEVIDIGGGYVMDDHVMVKDLLSANAPKRPVD